MPLLASSRDTQPCRHTILPQGHEARQPLCRRETKKTITLTYAPASALCGVAKLFTANTLRWCVSMRASVRLCVCARVLVRKKKKEKKKPREHVQTVRGHFDTWLYIGAP